MAAAVRIGVQPGRDWPDFDLRGVMNAVGPHPELDWWLYAAQFNCDVTTVWPEGIGIEEQTEERPGLALGWETMERLASVCHQIIDGFFVGYGDVVNRSCNWRSSTAATGQCGRRTRWFSTAYALLSTMSS